jgi:hypothetical protein
LFQSGIDEQIIKEKTQHNSLGGLRQYKQISNEQRVATADALIPKKKKVPSSSDVLAEKTNDAEAMLKEAERTKAKTEAI